MSDPLFWVIPFREVVYAMHDPYYPWQLTCDLVEACARDPLREELTSGEFYDIAYSVLQRYAMAPVTPQDYDRLAGYIEPIVDVCYRYLLSVTNASIVRYRFYRWYADMSASYRHITLEDDFAQDTAPTKKQGAFR